RVGVLVMQPEHPVRAVVKEVPVRTVAHGAQPGRRSQERATVHRKARLVTRKMRLHFAYRDAVDKRDLVMRAEVQAPAVDLAPGRMRIARGPRARFRLGLLEAQLRERRGGEVFVASARVGGKELLAAALDQ